MRNSVALVTGGRGFIGSRLVAGLLERGVAWVRVVDDGSFAGERRVPCDPRVEARHGDLGALSQRMLHELLDGVDALFHLAAVKHGAASTDPERLLRTNVAATHALLRAAADVGVKRVVFASSLYAHGRTAGPPLAEDEVPQPRTLYGASKLAGEQLVQRFFETRALPGLALRLFFVYGPDTCAASGRKSVIVRNFERLLDGLPPRVRGDGAQVLDYVHVDDAVRALCLAMESDMDHGVLNVGSGEGVSIEGLTAAMQAILGTKHAVEREPADETAGSCRVADARRIRSALSWTPRIGLAHGLGETLFALRSGSTRWQTASS